MYASYVATWLNYREYIRAKIILVSNLMVITSPIGMNIVICGVLIVERMINIFGIKLIYIAIYIRFNY